MVYCGEGALAVRGATMISDNESEETNWKQHKTFMRERRKNANKAYIEAMDGLLELLREDVSAIVSNTQVKFEERSQANRADINALYNKVELLSRAVESLTAKHNELKELVLSSMGEA